MNPLGVVPRSVRQSLSGRRIYASQVMLDISQCDEVMGEDEYDDNPDNDYPRIDHESMEESEKP